MPLRSSPGAGMRKLAGATAVCCTLAGARVGRAIGGGAFREMTERCAAYSRAQATD